MRVKDLTVSGPPDLKPDRKPVFRKENSVENPPAERPQKVGFVSLGCPKNLVDSEVMMGMLAQAGAELIPRAEDADVIVVNTCSFIDSAQQESVNTILEMAKHKTDGPRPEAGGRGCLVERFRDEIRKNIPEVDAVVGTGELEKILAAAGVAPAPRRRFPVQDSDIAPRRRCPRGAGTIFARDLGRRHRRSAQLSVRRSHAARAGDSAAHCLHQDRRGLRSSLHVSASFRSCAASSARAVLSRSSPRRNGWPARACARSRSSARTPPATAKTSA